MRPGYRAPPLRDTCIDELTCENVRTSDGGEPACMVNVSIRRARGYRRRWCTAPAITSRWGMDIEQALAGQGIFVLFNEELKGES